MKSDQITTHEFLLGAAIIDLVVSRLSDNTDFTLSKVESEPKYVSGVSRYVVSIDIPEGDSIKIEVLNRHGLK